MRWDLCNVFAIRALILLSSLPTVAVWSFGAIHRLELDLDQSRPVSTLTQMPNITVSLYEFPSLSLENSYGDAFMEKLLPGRCHVPGKSTIITGPIGLGEALMFYDHLGLRLSNLGINVRGREPSGKLSVSLVLHFCTSQFMSTLSTRAFWLLSRQASKTQHPSELARPR